MWTKLPVRKGEFPITEFPVIEFPVTEFPVIEFPVTEFPVTEFPVITGPDISGKSQGLGLQVTNYQGATISRAANFCNVLLRTYSHYRST